MAIGIDAVTASEAELIRKLGKTSRIYSAKQRLARLQKETRLPAGIMIRPITTLPRKGQHEKA